VLDIERLFWFGTWHLPGRAYAQQQQIPYITEYHTDHYGHLGTYPGGKWLRRLIFKPITQRLYRQCNQVLAISPAASQSLQQMGIPNSVELPIYGLDFSGFSPSQRDRDSLKQWLTPAQLNHKILLFVGRLACEKRVDLLIQAYAHLKPSHPNLSLMIAGDGPALPTLRQQAQTIADITFTGFVQGETKATLLASADLYCSPAPHETFGRTPLEAMAAGVPVVTVNSGGVADYIVAGVHGYLVPPNQMLPLAQTLALALAQDNSTMITNGLCLIDSFCLERAGQTLTSYYHTLITPRGSKP
jgi:phosphatidylinositol alpha 1,6-mannosyltransferase